MDAYARNVGKESVRSTTMRRRGWRTRAVTICAVGALTALGTAGTAAAAPVPININAQPVPAADPQITADLFYRGTDEWILTVTNSSANPDGENITEIDGVVAQPALAHGVFINRVSAQESNPGDVLTGSIGNGISISFTQATVNVCFEPATAQESFTCPTMYAGFGPGSTEEYVLTTNDTTESLPVLGSITVQMSVGACVELKHGQRQTASAADNCALPGVTKIVKAKINQKSRAVSFTYKAPFATKYVCELLSDKRIVHRTSCGPAKGYAGLTSGTYYFLVWGADRAGSAKKVTVYGFKIG